MTNGGKEGWLKDLAESARPFRSLPMSSVNLFAI